MNSIVRACTEEDMADLVAIEQATQESPWTEGIFRDCLKVGYENFLLEKKRQNRRFCDLSNRFERRPSPEFGGRTSGAKPWVWRNFAGFFYRASSRPRMHYAWLEVRKGNQPAVHLYEKAGFEFVSLRKNYYRSGQKGEDALVYRLFLSSP